MLSACMLKIGVFEVLKICVLANYVLSLYQQKGDKEARLSSLTDYLPGKVIKTVQSY